MSRIQLFVDEDAMDGGFVRALQSRGIDVLTAASADMIKRPDEEQLTFAADNHRTLYSFNIADYHELHAQWMAAGHSHAGIILTQQKRYSIGEQIRRTVRLIGSLTAESMVNRVEFLGRW